jgi:hypothetical protein
MTGAAKAALRNGGEFYGWRNEAGAAHEEGSEISGWRQKERGDRSGKTRWPATGEQAASAGNKGLAIAAPGAALTAGNAKIISPWQQMPFWHTVAQVT